MIIFQQIPLIIIYQIFKHPPFEFMFSQLNNYKLHGYMNDQKLRLEVSVAQENKITKWWAEISSLGECSEMFPNIFQNLDDLLEHIKDPSCAKFDKEAGILSILLKATIKNKESFTQVARIRLNLVKEKRIQIEGLDLENISSICSNQDNLSNYHIKTFFKIIVQKLKEMPTQQRIHEMLNPIINKFHYIGTQTESIKNKIGNTFQQLQEIRLNLHQTQQQSQEKTRQLKDYIEQVKEGIDRESLRYQDKIQDKFKDIQIKKGQMREQSAKIYREIQRIKAQIQDKKDFMGKIQDKIGKKDHPMMLKMDGDINPFDFLYGQSPYLWHFEVHKNIVTKVYSTDGQSTMLIGSKSFNLKRQFVVRIKKLKAYPILIGAIDNRHINQQFCEKNDKRVWISTGGSVFNGVSQRITGIILKENDVVKIIYGQSVGVFYFKIGNRTLPINQETPIRMNQWGSGPLYYPCVWIGDEGAAIQLLN